MRSVATIVAFACFDLSAAGHYEYPENRKCGDDEVYAHIYNTFSSTRTCAPKCDSNGGCPTDVPEGAGAKPACLLQDENGTKYCALGCSVVPFSGLTCPNGKGGAIKGECEELHRFDFVCMFTSGDRDDGAITLKHLDDNKTADSLVTPKNAEVVTQELPEDSTCAVPGDCGRAYQACCAGFEAKGYPCTCHLSNGTGKSGSDCGTCGTAYSACCAGFSLKGYPCTCDIAAVAGSIVV